jgi:molybdopterin-binding protein
MALVEIQAGPYLLAAAITSDAVEELGLTPGVEVIATIKATSVMVSREGVSG